MFFPKFLHMTKNTPFFPILHVFAPLNDVRAYSALSWKTTLITWIFGWAWYPPWHSSGPPGKWFMQENRQFKNEPITFDRLLIESGSWCVCWCRLISAYLLLGVNCDKIMLARWNFDASSAQTQRVSALDKHQNWSKSALFCHKSQAKVNMQLFILFMHDMNTLLCSARHSKRGPESIFLHSKWGHFDKARSKFQSSLCDYVHCPPSAIIWV